MATNYLTLGVSSDVTDTELKKAYRKLAMEFHPDKNPGNPEAEAKFKEVSEAYRILSDMQLRKDYDHQQRFGDSTSTKGMNKEMNKDMNMNINDIGGLIGAFFTPSSFFGGFKDLNFPSGVHTTTETYMTENGSRVTRTKIVNGKMPTTKVHDTKLCNNGNQCTFYKAGRCKYFHPITTTTNTTPCRNGDKCTYGAKCRFYHVPRK